MTPDNQSCETFIPFAVDNGAYASAKAGTPFDWMAYWKMLYNLRERAVRPLFVTVPDVPFDADGTLRSWQEHASRVREYGWPVAFVAQDGCRRAPDDADVVFVGGSTEWKWRTMPEWCRDGRPVHVGRVNSVDGLLACEDAGAASADGTVWQRMGWDSPRMQGLEAWIDGRARTQHQAQVILL